MFKILIVGKNRPGIAVSTEVWEQYGFRQNGATCDMLNILDERGGALTSRQIIAKMNLLGGYDAVMYYAVFDPDVIRATKRVAAKSANVTFDALLVHGEEKLRLFLECSDMVDFTFHTGGVPQCKKAIRVMQGCEPLLGLVRPQERSFGRPVFVGNFQNGRSKSLKDFLLGNGIDVLGDSGKNRYFRQDLFNLCHQRSVMVALHRLPDGYTIYDYPGYWSNRVYVTTGYAGCVLHPYCVGMDLEFEPDKEIVLYGSYDELLEKANALHKDNELCRHIAENAYIRSRSEHTYKNRTKKILDALKQ